MADPNQEMREAIIAMSQAVGTIANSLTTLQNAIAAATPAAPPAVTFSLTPATNKVDDLIDLGSRWGGGVYQDATASLYDSEEEKFDLDNDKLTAFQRLVEDRAKEMGWTSQNQGIVTYTVNEGGVNVPINIIQDYGRITIQEIRTQSEPFYLDTGAKSRQRAAQNNTMWAKTLTNSLTSKARDQIAIYKDEYLVQGSPTGDKFILAPALWKVIMRLTTLDTKMTNKALRAVIKDLPIYAVTVKGDIDLIHKRFLEHYALLKARGEEVDDKEGLLFDTYSHVPDAVFRTYMNKKKDDFYDNVNDMQNTNYEDIIKKAAAKLNLLKVSTDHVWGAPSDEEAQVIALKAELLKVNDKALKLSKQLKDIAAPDKAQIPGNGGDATPQPGGGKQKNRKNRSNKKKQNEDEAWKKIPPKPGESNTMQHDKKTWNWCKHHQAWCIHTEAKCKLGKERAAKQAAARNQANQATVDNASESQSLLAHMSAGEPKQVAYAQFLAQLASQSED